MQDVVGVWTYHDYGKGLYFRETFAMVNEGVGCRDGALEKWLDHEASAFINGLIRWWV